MAPDEIWSHETKIFGGVTRMARGNVCGGAIPMAFLVFELSS
jgi:hypothetical protein